MKGMYGLDVLVKLREMDPKALVVIASADIQSSTRKMVDEAGALAFVNKPFVSEQVIAAVESAFAEGDRVKLTERQRDALSELINIAFARTGAALSELTGHRNTRCSGGCGLSNGRIARLREVCSGRCRFHSSGFCRTDRRRCAVVIELRRCRASHRLTYRRTQPVCVSRRIGAEVLTRSAIFF